MAKQIGALKITGTFGGICFYCLDGVYYARKKSSLSAARVKKDPAFAETMRNATQMGNASKIASAIYRQIVPQHERSRDKFREVVSMVKRELAADARQGDSGGDAQKGMQIIKSHGLQELTGIEKTKDAVCLRGRRNVIQSATDGHKGTQIDYSATLVIKPRMNTKGCLLFMQCYSTQRYGGRREYVTKWFGKTDLLFKRNFRRRDGP